MRKKNGFHDPCRPKRPVNWLGAAVTAATFLLIVCLVALLAATHLFAFRRLAGVCGSLLLSAAALAWLGGECRRRRRFMLGLLLPGALCLVLAVAGAFTLRTLRTLDTIAVPPDRTVVRAQTHPAATRPAMQPATEPVPEPAAQPAPAGGAPFTVYLSGVDGRDGLDAPCRSDVNILAVVQPANRQVLLVSTPRDTYVPLANSGGAPDKLTHAGTYGIQVSIDTMQMLYEVPIEYYVKVNFRGFEAVIDSLGGVTVDSAYDFTTSDGAWHFTKGPNELNGAAALAFARERYAFADGDLQRGRNQLAVLRAVMDKACSPRLLTGYFSVLRAAEGSLETSVPIGRIVELLKARRGEGWQTLCFALTGDGATAQCWSLGAEASVLIPDRQSLATAKDLIARALRGERLSPADLEAS